MRHRKALTFGIVVILLVAVAIPALRKNSTAFNWLFSPSDLYKPRAVITINFAKEGQSYQLNFENKYPGLHWFVIQVTKPESVSSAYTGSFVLRLEVFHEGNVILSELINGPGSPFWDTKSGFEVHWYRSPEDLPLRVPLEAKLTVVRADPAFAGKYGTSQFVVKKLSDE